MRLHVGTAGLALAIGLLISGCGGGGSADSAALGATAPRASEPVIPPSGLVPAPDATGPVLYADAASLRVLRHGAVWHYGGTVQSGGAVTAPQTDFYRHSMSIVETAGRFAESGSGHPFIEGFGAVGPLRFEAGRLTHTENIMVGDGQAIPATFVELSSPVRQNEQFVALDRKDIAVNKDYDGDGVNDKVHLAAWTRVVGKERVDLPNRIAVETVRIDWTLRAQWVFSRGNAEMPVQEIVKSQWYAPGVGIVKRRLDRPDPNVASQRVVMTELLENFDGVSSGLGYIAASKTQVPVELAPTLSAASLQYPVAAVGFGTHAVVAAYLPDQPMAAGITLAQLDGRGQMLAARKYAPAELFPDAGGFNGLRLLRVGDELRLFAYTRPLGVMMLALDPTGQRILRAPVALQAAAGITPDREGNLFRVAQDGGRLWLNWIRFEIGDSAYPRTMMLQAFDNAGRPLGAERSLRSMVQRDIDQVGMVFANNRLAVSWRASGLSADRHIALVDGTSGAFTERILDLKDSTCEAVELFALQPGLAMSCRNHPAAPLKMARLDAEGNPVLAGAGLSGETLRAPWLSDFLYGVNFIGSGRDGELSMLARQEGRLWPEESTVPFTTVLRTRSLDGRPAGREPELLARIPALEMTVIEMLPLGNRLLLVGVDRAGDLHTAVVWLPD